MTELPLDTHTLLWWWSDNVALSDVARNTISEPDTAVFVSAANAWEIATKTRLGRLPTYVDVLSHFDELVTAAAFLHLPVTYLHSLRAGSYTCKHRDP